jgi:hypothetical protein
MSGADRTADQGALGRRRASGTSHSSELGMNAHAHGTDLAGSPARSRLTTILVGPYPKTSIADDCLFVAAAVLVGCSAAIHLHLWLHGYRPLPTVGPLFMAQVIAGLAISAALLFVRNVAVLLLAFGFVVSILGGFLISIEVGLFGFKDAWSAPFAQMAFCIEVAALLVLAVAGYRCARQCPAPSGPSGVGST